MAVAKQKQRINFRISVQLNEKMPRDKQLRLHRTDEDIAPQCPARRENWRSFVFWLQSKVELRQNL
jgi:hypothetical protein